MSENTVVTPAQRPQDRRLGDFSSVDTADAGNLVARLDAMHQMPTFKAYKEETFVLLGLSEGSVVADVGCGTGDDARALAHIVGPSGRVTGFDLSEAMLVQARERNAGYGHVEFVLGSSQGLPVPDATFDAIRADRVLLHVPDATATIQEMLRVLKPGGRLVISEPDMPGCWVASDDYRLTSRIMKQIADSCASPYLARDLYTLFQDAGVDDVRLLVRAIAAFDIATVATILDFGSVLHGMLRAEMLTEKEVGGWMEEFTARGTANRFAAGVSIFIASATKR